MQSVKSNTEERELIFSRLLDAPIKLVWKVWTNPDHLALWWGPDGFTNTIKKMDLKPGGEWNLIMHGPDGTDYNIRCVFREIVPEKKITYEQFTNFKCIATIRFESRGDKTFIHWHMLFESKEYLIQTAKAFGVVTGLQQNAERLVHYLSQFVDNQF
ncbi:MAG: polyketide cyclase [Bacteroidetes bacterium]|nr:MAG: polyketide cyclase [Bacteroidota bacterium]